MAAQTNKTPLDFDDIEIFGIVRPPKTCNTVNAPQATNLNISDSESSFETEYEDDTGYSYSSAFGPGRPSTPPPSFTTVRKCCGRVYGNYDFIKHATEWHPEIEKYLRESSVELSKKQD